MARLLLSSCVTPVWIKPVVEDGNRPYALAQSCSGKCSLRLSLSTSCSLRNDMHQQMRPCDAHVSFRRPTPALSRHGPLCDLLLRSQFYMSYSFGACDANRLSENILPDFRFKRGPSPFDHDLMVQTRESFPPTGNVPKKAMQEWFLCRRGTQPVCQE